MSGDIKKLSEVELQKLLSEMGPAHRGRKATSPVATMDVGDVLEVHDKKEFMSAYQSARNQRKLNKVFVTKWFPELTVGKIVRIK